jgi:spore coat polysaccharide biosynthesis protein SpsF
MMAMNNKMHQNVVAIIQARMGSSRLPGKILLDIMGKPILWHVVNRLKHSEKINNIVIAIPDTAPNDKLQSFVGELGVKCFRGSENDVLARYYGAALENEGDIIVRITSDCPLIDPRFTDSAIESHVKSTADYSSKGPSGGFPRGIDSEVFNFAALKKAYLEATQDYEREHVTPYLYQHPELFKINIVQATGKLRRELRLTVDTEEDFKLVKEIYKNLYKRARIFYIEDIIEFLESHPEMISINAHIKQKQLGQ